MRWRRTMMSLLEFEQPPSNSRALGQSAAPHSPEKPDSIRPASSARHCPNQGSENVNIRRWLMEEPKKEAATQLFWEDVPTIRSPQPQESGSRDSQKAVLALASKRTQARLEVQDAKRPQRHAPGPPASRTNTISSSRVPRLQLRSGSEIHNECKEPLARNP
jgi:hypothetical protein